VHRVASLAKRWLLGTHQGSVDNAHLASYLNEFVFRFNRRRKRVGTHRAWSALQRTAPGGLRAWTGPVKWIPPILSIPVCIKRSIV